MLIRLMRVAIQRNTALEEQLVEEREAHVDELERLRIDLVRIAHEHAAPGRRGRAARAAEARFAQTPLPRRVRRITVHGTAGSDGLDAGLRPQSWPEEQKRTLIARGRRLADAELRRAGLDTAARAS